MNMKIVFMGTPEYSASQLKWLMDQQYDVVGVVTQPDRPAGRGRKLTPPPVKQMADQLNLPCLQPEDLKSPDFHEELSAMGADLFVVVAYSILPQAVLSIPPKGSVNLHTSLLPKYRGAAPIQWSVLNGDSETGLTVFQLDEKMDHGPVLVRERLSIEEGDSSGDIFNKMIPLGQQALAQAIEELSKDQPNFQAQDHSQATKAPKLFKEMGDIPWDQSAQILIPWINGLNPWPTAYSQLNGKTFKLLKALSWQGEFNAKDPQPSEEPGTLAWGLHKEFLIRCSDAWIQIEGIQPQGKKPQSGPDIFNGLEQKFGQQFQTSLSSEELEKIHQLQASTR